MWITILRIPGKLSSEAINGYKTVLNSQIYSHSSHRRAINSLHDTAGLLLTPGAWLSQTSSVFIRVSCLISTYRPGMVSEVKKLQSQKGRSLPYPNFRFPTYLCHLDLHHLFPTVVPRNDYDQIIYPCLTVSIQQFLYSIPKFHVKIQQFYCTIE